MDQILINNNRVDCSTVKKIRENRQLEIQSYSNDLYDSFFLEMLASLSVKVKKSTSEAAEQEQYLRLRAGDGGFALSFKYLFDRN